MRHPHVYRPAAALVLVLFALPVIGMKTGMSSIKVLKTRPLRISAFRRACRRSAWSSRR